MSTVYNEARCVSSCEVYVGEMANLPKTLDRNINRIVR